VREVQDWLRVPCRLIPNGIDPAFTLQISPKVAALADQLGLWEADAVLLNPTRLLPRKVVEAGIKMTRAIRSLGLQMQYLITGAEDPHNPAHALYAKHLKVLTETLNLTDSVHFLGDSLDIGPRELADAYQLSDAIFLSSAREGFGLPVLEAGAFGKTVFCPDGEPLSSLPGAVTYSRELGIPELSSWMIQQLRMRETITARRHIFKNFRWPSVYKNHLAPLLQSPPHKAS
jgi:hypothetical protein